MNELKEKLFEIAMEWYQSGNSGKKEAAMELYPKEMLEAEIENYKKKTRKYKLEKRDEDLKNILEECKRLFPIGTAVWSDDGTDHCVNIIVEEPHIEKVQYRCPYNIYDFNETNRKSVIAKTVRIEYYGNDVIDDKCGRSSVCLEILLDNMKRSDDKWVNTKPIINLKDLHIKKSELRDNEIQKIKKEILEHQNRLNQLNLDLNELELWDPNGLTEEKIQEIVKKYGK